MTAVLISGLVGFSAPAKADIQIGFCNGSGLLETTIKLRICCPPLGLISTETTTLVGLDCSDAAGVMAAVGAALGAMMFTPPAPYVGGPVPIFAGGGPIPSDVAGQARWGFSPSAAFLATGCCVIGGGITFDCGTFSIRFDEPCPKADIPGGGGSKIKFCFDGPPPGPSTVAIKFEDCPFIFIPLDGTETADEARDKVLAVLDSLGYTAYINGDDKLEVCTDCSGDLPLAVSEFGLSGGLPMLLGVETCPPFEPVPTDERTWGYIKSLFSGSVRDPF